jgi:hypothetical protein
MSSKSIEDILTKIDRWQKIIIVEQKRSKWRKESEEGKSCLYWGLFSAAKTLIARLACGVAYDRLRRLSRHCSHIQYMQLAFDGMPKVASYP